MGEVSFGKYRLIAELGHGGMADVFLAVMAGPAGSGFSKLTVIKRLRQNLAEEPEFVAMLVDEARIAARLNHPNVVQTNEVGQEGNLYFMAMEYLDGQPLHRIQHRAQNMKRDTPTAAPPAMFEKKPDERPSSQMRIPTPSPISLTMGTDPFPAELQYLVLLDTLSGLHHAHELADYDGTPLQIVHRDVTPHNIFVTYEGQVKVVDFGIAKAVGRASETRQGVVKGKVRYMAPEQAIGQAVDRRADIFSVGVMLWEAATGRRLWKDMDDLEIVQALVSGDIKSSPREFNPDVPEAIDTICKKALASRPEDRYQTADELRAAIEQYLTDSGKLVDARRKLGPAVAELFKDKRVEIRAVIEKQLAALNTKPTVDLRATSPDSSSTQKTPSSTSTVTVNVEDGTASILTDAAPTELYDPKRRARERIRRVAAFAGAGVVLASAAAMLVSIRSSGKTEQPVTLASAEPKVEEIKVSITVNAPNAEITLDGQKIGAPYEGRAPRDAKEHQLHVEAPGFEPFTQTLSYASDVVLPVTMKPAAQSPLQSASAKKDPVAVAPPQPRWQPKPAPTPTVDPAKDPDGLSMRPKKKAPAPIDSTDDPWKATPPKK
jgi:serine/threonine-protein kinase